MTADELLLLARVNDVRLEAQGARLRVEAPVGVVTPPLRAELTQHKPALMAMPAPVTEFIPLKGGLVVPAPALRVTLDLEQRGFRMWLDQNQQFQTDQSPDLSEADRVGIDRWRSHLGAILVYDADAMESVL